MTCNTISTNRAFYFFSPHIVVNLLAGLLTMITPLAYAYSFNLGPVDAKLGTTLKYGASFRVQSPDKDLIGIGNGGKKTNTNNDDANLNYTDTGLFSHIGGITSELDMNYKNYGVFLRGTFFYDIYNQAHKDRELSGAAENQATKEFKMLDAYVSGRFDIADRALEVRLGDQVISWGESTFIPGGINVINPIDLYRFRTPGADLKDALTPIRMLWSSMDITDSINLEAFYQIKHDVLEMDVCGTYFSVRDFLGKDCNFVSVDPDGVVGDNQTDSMFFVPRAATNKPKNSGQFGLGLRFFTGNTEFGLFYMNYHARLPLISAIAARDPALSYAAQRDLITAGIVTAATPTIYQAIYDEAYTAIYAAAYAQLLPIFGAVVANAQATAAAGPMATTAANDNTAAAAATFAATEVAKMTDADVLAATGVPALPTSGNYFVEYPENINVWGLSFSTELGRTGIALQGEYSWRPNKPLQIDAQEVIAAAMWQATSQLGAGAHGQYIKGYRRHHVSQYQITATKILSSPFLWASQSMVLLEAGGIRVHGLPSQHKLLYANDATSSSWGYNLMFSLDYFSAIGAIDLTPSINFSHNVNGNSPAPDSTFLENRKALGIGLDAKYLDNWSAGISYTRYFGTEKLNFMHDRDFVSANIQYNF